MRSASAALSASAPLASASAAPSAAATSPALPSQADEAVKAGAEIDKGNYKAELDKLEKEITAK